MLESIVPSSGIIQGEAFRLRSPFCTDISAVAERGKAPSFSPISLSLPYGGKTNGEPPTNRSNDGARVVGGLSR